MTALATGEVGQRDGLADLAIGIAEGHGGSARLLVFRSPRGALRAEPEVHALAAGATAIVVGKLDEDAFGDVAVAAGDELRLVLGRHGEAPRSPAPAAREVSAELPGPVAEMSLAREAGCTGAELDLLGEDGIVRSVSCASLGAGRPEFRPSGRGERAAREAFAGPAGRMPGRERAGAAAAACGDPGDDVAARGWARSARRLRMRSSTPGRTRLTSRSRERRP